MDTRKCLRETRTLPLASYPLGKTSQFNRPVPLNKINRIKDETLTAQSLKAFLLFINFLLEIKKRKLKICGGFSRMIDPCRQHGFSMKVAFLGLKFRNAVPESCTPKNTAYLKLYQALICSKAH
jgi:hypothetical protein